MAQERSALTGRTKTTRAALGQALAQVRRRGYAVENQEATVGDAGIAAPIVSRDGVVAGAIGLVGPAERLLDRADQAETGPRGGGVGPVGLPRPGRGPQRAVLSALR